VLFHTTPKVGIRVVRAIEDAYGGEVVVCVVSLDGPTPCTKKVNGEPTPAGGRRIQYLTYVQVLRDPSSHCMVPKHRRLEAAERGAVEARYNIAQDADWPKIGTKDPVCRFYDFTPGDLLEIQRVGLVSCGDQRYYRLVVASPA
jgi:DNA-directed RNA polymerase subunit H (RpoH/RPB5)